MVLDDTLSYLSPEGMGASYSGEGSMNYSPRASADSWTIYASDDPFWWDVVGGPNTKPKPDN